MMAHLLAIHVAVFLFGLSGLLGKMTNASSHFIVFGRASLAALALGLVTWFMHGNLRLKRQQFLFLAGSGVVLTVHWLTFFIAIKISTVAIGLLSFASFPLFVTLLEPWFFRERLQARDIVTVAMVLTGLWLVTPSFNLQHHLTQGVVWGILSGFTFAVLSILNRQWVQGLSPMIIGAGQNAMAAIILLPWLHRQDWVLSGKDIGILLALGLGCTAFAHALFIQGLARVRAQVASIIACLEPIYGILFAILIIHETPSLKTSIGGCIIVGTTVLTTFWQDKKAELA